MVERPTPEQWAAWERFVGAVKSSRLQHLYNGGPLHVDEVILAVAVEVERLRERERVLREALEDARHQLVTLDGLTASDGLDSYAAALAAGCDAGGAWDCYREATWRMDTTSAIKRIDAALAGQGEGGQPA